MRTAYDFVVLGAGAAGCAAARALALRHPAASIALVEQGSRCEGMPTAMRVPLLQPLISASPRTGRFLRQVSGVPETNLGGRELHYTKGCGLGGSTLTNDMRYLRGTRADFAAWKDPEWTFDTLRPSFLALEGNTRPQTVASVIPVPEHNQTGPICVSDASRSNVDAPLNVRFFDACEAAGLSATDDFNAGTTDGFSSLQATVRGGERENVFKACLGTMAKEVKNVNVLTETFVERLTFSGTTATGVQVRRGLATEQLSAGAVVICLGALESPALLLRSGVGAAGSVVDLPHVGKNLIVGCAVDVVMHTRQGTGLQSKALSWGNVRYLRRQWREYAEDHSGAFSSLVEAAAFVRATPELETPNLSLLFFSSAHVMWSGWRNALPHDGFTVRVTLHYPRSRGEVTVSNTPTPQTRVRSGMLTEKQDVIDMDEGLKWCGLLTTSDSGLQSVHYDDGQMNAVSPFWGLKPVLAHPASGLHTQRDVAAFLAQFARPSSDLFGTCAMGDVVDSRLRVKGLTGVHVADASVVPTPTVASSAVLGAAIGHRVASFT